MSCTEIFLIGEIKPLSDDTWLVRGRAYEDVRVGDLIYPEESVSQDSELAEPLRIIAISSYQEDVNVLYRMMTGDLTVLGSRSQRLDRSHMLVRCVQTTSETDHPIDQPQSA